MQATESSLEYNQIFMVGHFCKNVNSWKFWTIFAKKAPPQTLGWLLNTNLGSTLKKTAIKIYFSSYVKPFVFIPFNAYFTSPHKSEKKCVNKRNWTWNLKRDWTFEIYLLTGKHISCILPTQSLKITCARSYAWFLNFLSKGRGFRLFFMA